MGIEVWKLRKDEVSMLNDLSEPALPVIAEKRMGGKDQHVAISDDFPATPRFRIAMLHYGSIGICVSLEQDADFPRRFCDDLARFMAADLQSLKLVLSFEAKFCARLLLKA